MPRDSPCVYANLVAIYIHVPIFQSQLNQLSGYVGRKNLHHVIKIRTCCLYSYSVSYNTSVRSHRVYHKSGNNIRRMHIEKQTPQTLWLLKVLKYIVYVCPYVYK